MVTPDKDVLLNRFPPEVTQIILSFLSIKEWSSLQTVCKSWQAYLNDPHLWATSIDFSAFNAPKCNKKNLKICLGKVFGKAHPLSRSTFENIHIKAVKHLKLTNFTSPTAEAECLQMLHSATMIHYGEVNELEIDSLYNGDRNSESNSLFLTPTQYLTLRWSSDVTLNWILCNNPRLKQLRVYRVDCRNQHREGNLYTFCLGAKFPHLKRMDVECLISDIHMLTCARGCPNLEHFGYTAAKREVSMFDVCQAFGQSDIKSLYCANAPEAKRLNSYEPAPRIKTIPKWPSQLTELSLHRIDWSKWQGVAGNLEQLQVLDLTRSEVDLNLFFEKYNCGDSLKILILKEFKGNKQHSNIWLKCPNLAKLSLVGLSTSPEEIEQITKVCPKLREVDLGSSNCTQETVLNLAMASVKYIGCKSININDEYHIKYAQLGADIAYEELKMN